MRQSMRQGIWGGSLAMLLLGMPAASAQNPPPTAANPAPAVAKHAVKPVKPTHQSAAKKTDPAKSHKVAAHTAKPKPSEKKVAAAPKKPAAPVKTASAAPKKPAPSYTITTTGNNGAYRTTRVVPVSATATARPATAPVTRVAALPTNATPAVERTPPTAPSANVAAPQPGTAAAASTFVSRFLGDAFRIARAAELTSLQRRAQLADLFAAKMDMPRIADGTGGDQLNASTQEVQRRFRTLLISYLVETYYPRLELASDPSVSVETVPAEPLPDGTAVVWTKFSRSGTSQSVKWHLMPEAGGFKIVDIFSASASLVQMERDTFRSVMRNGGLPELMAKLDARTKALATASPN